VGLYVSDDVYAYATDCIALFLSDERHTRARENIGLPENRRSIGRREAFWDGRCVPGRVGGVV